MISRLEDSPPTYRQMLALWLPLATSTAIMVVEPSIINIGLGRTADPDLALAAYGVAYGLALLIESPVITLLDASVARSVNRAAFLLVRRFTVYLGLLVTAVGLIVSLTPLYGPIVVGLLKTPPDVAERTRTTLQVLSLWPFPIAWRRAHQGVLIRAGRTGMVSLATAVRLVVLGVLLAAGLLIMPAAGALVAGIAMLVSVTVEGVMVTFAAARVLREDTSTETDLTMGQLRRFYGPLATYSIVRQAARPILNVGIAATLLPLQSLAAWPVVWGFVFAVCGPAWSLQQLVTALSKDEADPSHAIIHARLTGFTLAVSVLSSIITAAVALPPLYGLVMGGIYNLSPELQALSLPALCWLIVYPLLMGLQSLLRGILIRRGLTASVSSATLAGLVALVLVLILGALGLPMVGVTLAAVATLLSGVVEWAWLAWRSRRVPVVLGPSQTAIG